MKLSEKRASALKMTMNEMASMMVPFIVRVISIPEKSGIGYSTVTGKEAVIGICFSFNFKKNITEQEMEYVLYGVFTHEMLHVLLTDFETSTRMIKKYPVYERKIRHTFANIVEDPAIEYQKYPSISNFLSDSLAWSIRYFYMAAPELNCNSAFEELISALIQFGDIGFIKGNFKFSEAKETFKKIAPIMLEAMEEPDFTKRFLASQKMFEIAKKLWKDFEQNEFLANSIIQELLKKLGKEMSSQGKSMGENNQNQNCENNNDPAQKRRQQIVQICIGLSSPEQSSDNTEIGKGGSSEKNKNSQESHEQNGNSESWKSSSETNKASEKNDNCNVSEEVNGKNNGGDNTGDSSGQKEGSYSEADKSSSIKESEEGNRIESENNPENDSSSNGEKEKEGTNPSGEKKSQDGKRGNDSNQNNSSDSNENSFESELRKFIEENRNSVEMEAGHISEDTISAIDDLMKSAIKSMETEQKKLMKQMDLENINPDVSGPYYSNYPYVTQKVKEVDNITYSTLNTTEIKQYTLNFQSSLSKIFKDPRLKKDYKTNGRLSVKRYSGKATARVFYKTTHPDNKADIAIVILLDQSGSMRSSVDKMKQTMIILLNALRKFPEVSIKVIGFTSLGNDVNYFHYGKSNKWTNIEEVVKSVMKLEARGGTFLGHAIRYSAKLLKKRPEKHKIFICVTDGYPEHGDVYRSISEGVADCKMAVNEVKKFSDVIGVGMYFDSRQKEWFENIFQESCVSMTDLENLTRELPKRIRKILK